jgi:hypothetical protein
MNNQAQAILSKDLVLFLLGACGFFALSATFIGALLFFDLCWQHYSGSN